MGASTRLAHPAQMILEEGEGGVHPKSYGPGLSDAQFDRIYRIYRMKVFHDLVNRVNPVGDTPADCQLAEDPGSTREATLFDICSVIEYTVPCLGAVAQLGERINRTDKARGSSPLSSTLRPSEGQMNTPDHRGAVAQLGARLTGSQKVRGSNPLSSTFSFVSMLHISSF